MKYIKSKKALQRIVVNIENLDGELFKICKLKKYKNFVKTWVYCYSSRKYKNFYVNRRGISDKVLRVLFAQIGLQKLYD